ncbi:hypothetical protein EVAR_20365_1 [Eumeta japonica]|uniref:Uncharacterized protein n=1 Tax=Eumeta variegata TaxID=151549 RepID=A0A4C1VTA7_EUMVA|nr:hypothetical protein EVAR_20365_1 [Eumeta japonica]
MSTESFEFTELICRPARAAASFRTPPQARHWFVDDSEKEIIVYARVCVPANDNNRHLTTASARCAGARAGVGQGRVGAAEIDARPRPRPRPHAPSGGRRPRPNEALI